MAAVAPMGRRAVGLVGSLPGGLRAGLRRGPPCAPAGTPTGLLLLKRGVALAGDVLGLHVVNGSLGDMGGLAAVRRAGRAWRVLLRRAGGCGRCDGRSRRIGRGGYGGRYGSAWVYLRRPRHRGRSARTDSLGGTAVLRGIRRGTAACRFCKMPRAGGGCAVVAGVRLDSRAGSGAVPRASSSILWCRGCGALQVLFSHVILPRCSLRRIVRPGACTVDFIPRFLRACAHELHRVYRKRGWSGRTMPAHRPRLIDPTLLTHKI